MKKLLLGFSLILFFLTSDLTGQENPELYIQPQYRNEIKTLVANSLVENAFQWIKDQDSVTLLDHILLTEIEAPPFKEEKRAAPTSKNV